MVKCVLTCYSWCLPTPRRLGGGDPVIFSSGACEKARCGCERLCARLTGAVKSNFSGFKVWRGSLVLTGSRSSGGLIEERLNIESTSTWIRGDRQVTETTGKIRCPLW